MPTNRVYMICAGSADMTNGTVVTLKLNQQQLELIDRTVARGVAPDRAALVRLALREYAAAHLAARCRQGGEAMSARQKVCGMGDGARHRQGGRASQGPDLAHRAGRRRPMRRLQLLQPARLQGIHALRAHPHGARLPSLPRHLHVVGAAARARDALHPRGHLRPQRRAVSRAAAPMSTRAPTGSTSTPTATTSRPRRSANTGSRPTTCTTASTCSCAPR